MTHRIDIYGFAASTLEQARARVEAALGYPLVRSESEARGVSYRSGSTLAGATLYHNWIGDRCIRPDHASWPVLLVLSDLADMDGVQRRLLANGDDPVLIQSSTYTDDPDDEP